MYVFFQFFLLHAKLLKQNSVHFHVMSVLKTCVTIRLLLLSE